MLSNYGKPRTLLVKISVPIATAALGIFLNIDAMPEVFGFLFTKWFLKSIAGGFIPLLADFTGKKSANEKAQERNEKYH